MTKAFNIVFLVGMPGVGKTFFGKCASQNLKIPFFDLDTEIVKKYKISIATIFETKGETEFRQIELDTLKEIVKRCKGDTIVATGGGTPCFNNAMEFMNNYGITVWLDAEIEDLYFNIIEDNPDRPLFNTTKKGELVQKLGEMKALRQKFYEQSRVKVSIYRGLSPDLFTKRLHLSTFAK